MCSDENDVSISVNVIAICAPECCYIYIYAFDLLVFPNSMFTPFFI